MMRMTKFNLIFHLKTEKNYDNYIIFGYIWIKFKNKTAFIGSTNLSVNYNSSYITLKGISYQYIFYYIDTIYYILLYIILYYYI